MSQHVRTLGEEIPSSNLDEIASAVIQLFKTGDSQLKISDVMLPGDSLQQSARKAMDEAFQISFAEILIDGFRALRRIQKLLGPDGPMDGNPNVVTVRDDSVTFTTNPKIILVVNEVRARPIDIEIRVTLKFGIFAVTVVDRKIVGFSEGRVSSKVSIKVNDIEFPDIDLGTIGVPEMRFGDRANAV